MRVGRRILIGIFYFLSVILLDFQVISNEETSPDRVFFIKHADSVPILSTITNNGQQAEIFRQLAIPIVQNHGQVDAKVQFYTKSKGLDIFFTQKEISLSLHCNHREEKSLGTAGVISVTQIGKPKTRDTDAISSVMHLIPLGMKNGLKIEPGKKLESKVNYLIGSDPQKWRTNIPTYDAVIYRDAYPGIDLKFYGNGRQFEYDVIVGPGADPNIVKFQYSGIKSLNITPEGNLSIKLSDGSELLQKKPIVYQEIAGTRVAREGKFKIYQEVAQLVYGFEVASYDKDFPLVIDPVLVYSTYLGGNSEDLGNGIAIDKVGNVYVIGSTLSSDFPIANPLQTSNKGSYDIIVTKINSAGSGLVYSTYLGGTGKDIGKGIAVDETGNVYITGYTYSTNFPTESPIQSVNKGSRDAFIAKINNTGSALIYSTYMGGSDDDSGEAVAVDKDGNAYVTGYTYSINFPTQGPIQSVNKGDRDAFIAKINATGSSIVYSTYLGGSGQDSGISIAVDQSGHAFVAGNTTSSDFPTRNPLQGSYKEGGDVFVAKLNILGSSLDYSTYLGGTGEDSVKGIAIDQFENVYITGQTTSNDFPTKNPLQSINMASYGSAFVTKINSNGSGLGYSTYLGGSDDDSGMSIAVTGSGCVYIAGYTFSNDFPTKNPLQGFKDDNYDAFIAKLNNSGSALAFSTFFGGSGYDEATGIAVDKTGNVYVTGYTFSGDFPLQNPLQPQYKFDYEAFVVKIKETNKVAPIVGLLLGN